MPPHAQVILPLGEIRKAQLVAPNGAPPYVLIEVDSMAIHVTHNTIALAPHAAAVADEQAAARAVDLSRLFASLSHIVQGDLS